MDKNGFLDALTAYSRNPCPEIPAILEQYLNRIAANGETLFHWPLLKPLLFAKMEQVIEELQKGLSSEVIPERPNVENVPFDVMHARIVDAFHKFNGTPFTIQRLCELLTDPKRHYKRSDKFLRGLEKNVLVVSTVDPFGRNVVSEVGNKHLVNGMDTVGSPFFPRDSNITSNLPPVPGWVTSAPCVTSPQSVTPIAVSDKKQSQPSSQDTAVTTSVVSGGLVTSLYGEQPQASQTEEVVEETVVTMDTSETSVVPDSRETGSEEEGMGREDSNTSSSSSSSSEELSTNDTSDSSSDVQAPTIDTYKSHTSPWVSVVTEGENKVHVSSPDDGDDDRSGGEFAGRSDKSVSETPPSQAVSDGQADSFLSSSRDSSADGESVEKSSSCVDPSSSADSESVENSSSCVDTSSSELSMDTSCVQHDSYNDSTGFDTAFTSEEINTPEHSDICSESQNLSGVSSEASSMDTTPPATDVTVALAVQPNQPADSICSNSEVTASSDVCSQSVTTPVSRDEHSSTPSLEKADSSLETTSSSPPTQPVDLSPAFHSSASRSTHVNPSSPDSPSDCQEPQAKRRRLSDDFSDVCASSKTSSDVTISSNLHASSKTSSDVTISSNLHASFKTADDITVSSDLQVSSNTSDDVTDSSDVHVSSNTSDDVTASSDVHVSSNTSGDVTVLSEYDSIPTTRSNMASDSSNPAATARDQNSDIHEPVDSEPAVNTEAQEISEGREYVASPPSQEASSSDSQGFDAMVEIQDKSDTEATNAEESMKSEEFNNVAEVEKMEELAKEEETAEGNLVNPQN